MQLLKESQNIVARFHESLAKLKADKKIRGIQTFTTRYNIDKRLLYRSAREHQAGTFEAGWLLYLVRDFEVNPEWLITGKGDFYQKKEKPKCCAKFVHPDILNV